MNLVEKQIGFLGYTGQEAEDFRKLSPHARMSICGISAGLTKMYQGVSDKDVKAFVPVTEVVQVTIEHDKTNS